MKKKLFMAILVVVLFVSSVAAGQKYNPHERRWETVPDGYKLRYHPHERHWSYQDPDARQEYNPHEHRWEWNPEPYRYKKHNNQLGL